VLLRMLIARLPPQGEQLMSLLPEYQFFFQRYSYPSGHAVTVMVTYGAMMLAARRWPIPRILVSLVGALIIVIVGVGRLYLGVHWPSDVAAGYILGIIWLTATVLLYNPQITDITMKSHTA
ncbi:MAG TPA: phosphatase PAP2 family protein, partial [Anaerolineae bacterium]